MQMFTASNDRNITYKNVTLLEMHLSQEKRYKEISFIT